MRFLSKMGLISGLSIIGTFVFYGLIKNIVGIGTNIWIIWGTAIILVGCLFLVLLGGDLDYKLVVFSYPLVLSNRRVILGAKLVSILLYILCYFFVNAVPGVLVNSWYYFSFLNGVRVIFGFIILLIGIDETVKILHCRLFNKYGLKNLPLSGMGLFIQLFIISIISFIALILGAGSSVPIIYTVFLVGQIIYNVYSAQAEENSYSKRESNHRSFTFKFGHLVFLLLVMGVMIQTHGSVMSLKYLLPGDMWVVLNNIKYMAWAGPMGFFNIKSLYYPIGWSGMVYGCSAIFGLPAINTAVLMNYLNFITIPSLYLYIKMLVGNGLPKKYLNIFVLLCLASGSYNWIYLAFGMIDIWALYTAPYLLLLFTFSYYNIFLFSVFWSLGFASILEKVNNTSAITQKDKNIFVFMAAFMIFIGYFIHFIELFISVPVLYWLYRAGGRTEGHKFVFKFITYFFMLLIGINLVTDSYYIKFFIYIIGYILFSINREDLIFLHYELSRDVFIMYGIVISFYVVFLILYLNWNKIYGLLEKIFLKINKLKNYMLPRGSQANKIYKILVYSSAVLLSGITALWWHFRIITGNYSFSGSLMHPPLVFFVDKIVLIPFFIIGFGYLEHRLKKPLGWGFIYIYLMGLMFWSQRFWRYASIFLFPIVCYLLEKLEREGKGQKVTDNKGESNASDTGNVEHKKTKKSIDLHRIKVYRIKLWLKRHSWVVILGSIMLLAFPSNAIRLAAINADNAVHLEDDMAEVIHYLEDVNMYNSSIYVDKAYWWEGYFIKKLSFYNVIGYNDELKKDPAEFLLLNNITFILVKYTDLNSPPENIALLLNVTSYSISFISANRIYSILRVGVG